jgi:hypothetical protein
MRRVEWGIHSVSLCRFRLEMGAIGERVLCIARVLIPDRACVALPLSCVRWLCFRAGVATAYSCLEARALVYRIDVFVLRRLPSGK